MAVAPLPQVTRVLKYGVSEIPPGKIFMGIPNYGYDWTLPYEPQVSRARSIGNPEAVELAAANGAEIFYDKTAQSPYFHYTQDGRIHEVWFEDIRSIQAKFTLLDSLSLLGAGYWNVMRPFPQNWCFLAWRYHIKKFV